MTTLRAGRLTPAASVVVHVSVCTVPRLKASSTNPFSLELRCAWWNATPARAHSTRSVSGLPSPATTSERASPSRAAATCRDGEGTAVSNALASCNARVLVLFRLGQKIRHE